MFINTTHNLLAQNGTKEFPFKLPDAKRDSNAINKFHQLINIEIDKFLQRHSDLRESIRAIPNIRNDKPQLNKELRIFELPTAKKAQKPYDLFCEHLCVTYSCDPIFKGKPKELTSKLLNEIKNRDKDLDKKIEYIFAVTEHKLLIIPRNELICIEDTYFMGRHTHLCFSKEEKVQIAGTMKGNKFNFRTGHYLVHQHHDISYKEHARKVVGDLIKYAENKTLVSNKNKLHLHSLSYDNHQNSIHTPEQEVEGRINTPSSF